MKAKKTKQRSVGWKIEKHYRWAKRYLIGSYLKKVNRTEIELGEKIEPC